MAWFNANQPDAPILFAFGKTPKFGDFIEFNLGSAPWLKFVLDDLALKGSRAHPDRWFDLDVLPRIVHLEKRGVFRVTRSVDFWMGPSADSHGRRFPLLLGWLRATVPKPDSVGDQAAVATQSREALSAQLREWSIEASPDVVSIVAELSSIVPPNFRLEAGPLKFQRGVSGYYLRQHGCGLLFGRTTTKQ